MPRSIIAKVETYFYALRPKRRLEMVAFYEAALTEENFAFAGLPDYFVELENAAIGEKISRVLPPEYTERYKVTRPVHLLREQIAGEGKIKKGELLFWKDGGNCLVAKVKNADHFWVEIETFPSWISGKEILIESVIKHKRELTKEDPEPYPNRVRYWKPELSNRMSKPATSSICASVNPT